MPVATCADLTKPLPPAPPFQVPKLLKPPEVDLEELKRRIRDPEARPFGCCVFLAVAGCTLRAGLPQSRAPARPARGARGGGDEGSAARIGSGPPPERAGPLSRLDVTPSALPLSLASPRQVKRQRHALGRLFRQFGLDQFRMSRYVRQHRQALFTPAFKREAMAALGGYERA